MARLLIITECTFINAVCYGCDSKGHIQECAGRLGSESEKEKWLNTWWNNEQRISQFFSTSTHVDIPQILLQISNVNLVFELDTGAAVSLVYPYIWKRIAWTATLDVAKYPTFQLWQATDSSQRRMQRHCVLQCGNRC